MFTVAVITAVALVAGILVGRALARRGVTADTALTRRQAQAYAVFLGVAGLGALLYWGPYAKQRDRGENAAALAEVLLASA